MGTAHSMCCAHFVKWVQILYTMGIVHTLFMVCPLHKQSIVCTLPLLCLSVQATPISAWVHCNTLRLLLFTVPVPSEHRECTVHGARRTWVQEVEIVCVLRNGVCVGPAGTQNPKVVPSGSADSRLGC